MPKRTAKGFEGGFGAGFRRRSIFVTPVSGLRLIATRRSRVITQRSRTQRAAGGARAEGLSRSHSALATPPSTTRHTSPICWDIPPDWRRPPSTRTPTSAACSTRVVAAGSAPVRSRPSWAERRNSSPRRCSQSGTGVSARYDSWVPARITTSRSRIRAASSTMPTAVVSGSSPRSVQRRHTFVQACAWKRTSEVATASLEGKWK